MANLFWIYFFTVALTLTGSFVLWGYYGFDRNGLNRLAVQTQNKKLFLGLASLFTIYLFIASVVWLMN